MLDMIGSFTGGFNTHLVVKKGGNFIYREFFLTPTFFFQVPHPAFGLIYFPSILYAINIITRYNTKIY